MATTDSWRSKKPGIEGFYDRAADLDALITQDLDKKRKSAEGIAKIGTDTEMQIAKLNSGTRLQEAELGQIGAVNLEKLRQTGDTARQRLIQAGDVVLEGLRSSSEMRRQTVADTSAMGRLKANAKEQRATFADRFKMEEGLRREILSDYYGSSEKKKPYSLEGSEDSSLDLSRFLHNPDDEPDFMDIPE